MGIKPAGGSDSFGVFDVTASALAAERSRLAVIAQNIANAQVTGNEKSPPYRRQRAVFETELAEAMQRGRVGGRAGGGVAGGVKVRIEGVPGEFPRMPMPGDPHADKDGWVQTSNVNVVDEMVDMLDASRSYEANLTALRTWRKMLEQTIEMAR